LAYAPYAPFLLGNVPRADLIVFDKSSTVSTPIRALEIKLTTLPDNSTANLAESAYGSEIVVRPDTIVYLGLSIASEFRDDYSKIGDILDPFCKTIVDWTDPAEVKPLIGKMASGIDSIFALRIEKQRPILLQPIWKTLKKTTILADNCFDVFVWSDFALARLFINATLSGRSNDITRTARAIVWLVKMLYDFSLQGQFNGEEILDKLTFNTKNDKAFAISGLGTHPYMASSALTTPRIPKSAVKELILGGGQNLLSPERRLDAAILNTPGLFT
jgi:hypothetical protein